MSSLHPSSPEHALVSAQNLLSLMPQPAYLKRLDGRYLEVNTAWAEIFGKSPAEFAGKRDYHLLPLPVARLLESNDGEFWKRGEATEIEEAFEIPGRPVYGFRTVRTPMMDDKGAFAGLLGVCQPLEATTKAPSVGFGPAALMAAEMQLPLNSILGFASLVGEGSLTVEQAEWIESINLAARSLLSTSSSFIEMSQIIGGELEAEHRLFSLRDTIRDGVQRHLTRMMEQKLTIAYKVDPGVPEVLLGDRGRVRRILHQLLDNAVKFTQEGEITIRAHREPAENHQAMITLSVSDTGPGIPGDQLGVVLEPFRRVEHGDHHRADGEGVGLGLALARALAKSLGGDLHLRNRAEGGLEAVVTFLADPGASAGGFIDVPPSQIGAGMPSLPSEKGMAPRKRLKVLMAEDLPSAQKLSYYVFRKIGHDVTLVGNGEQLIEALRQDEYDAVFLDIQMPVMDGLEAARQIRDGKAGEKNREIFLAAITACVTDEIKMRCFTAGMNHFLDKPLLAEKLKQVIQRIEAGRQAES